jgi:hypothetical protein
MLKKRSKTALKILIFIGGFLLLERFTHHQTRGFSLPHIYTDQMQNLPSVSVDPEILTELEKGPFTFLDSGLECYAFLSADGKTVLKVFKHHHLRQAHFLSQISSHFTKLYDEKKKRLENSFASYRLAEKELKSETGLLFLHLGKTKKTLPTVTLIDKLGIEHKVALDEVHFLLQKRATLLLPALEKQVKEKRLSEAEKTLHSLLDLIVQRCKKGISDRDPTLCKNYGFLGTQAIMIDLGSFSKNSFLKDPHSYKRELFYETLPLRCLLQNRFPELLPFFETELNKIIETRDPL